MAEASERSSRKLGETWRALTRRQDSDAAPAVPESSAEGSAGETKTAKTEAPPRAGAERKHVSVIAARLREREGATGDADPEAALALADASVVEGNAGTSELTFTVTKSGSTELPASVEFATSDETATVGEDYAASTGTLIAS